MANGKVTSTFMLAAFAVLILPLMAVRAEPASMEGIGGAIMPLGGLVEAKTEVAVEKMRKIQEMSGISIFSTGGPGRAVRVNGVADMSVYTNIGRKIEVPIASASEIAGRENFRDARFEGVPGGMRGRLRVSNGVLYAVLTGTGMSVVVQ